MALDDVFDVFCAAVTDFDVITVEYFIEFMMPWEMLVDKLKEFAANLGFNVLIEWGIEPYDIAFPVL